MTIKEILTRLGGPAAIARHLGVTSQAVSLWAIKQRIPADRVPALEALARAAGLPIRAEHMRPDIEWSALRVPA